MGQKTRVVRPSRTEVWHPWYKRMIWDKGRQAKPCEGQHGRDFYLVTKLSASRSSTVCLSMFGGTKSRPFLAQRVARLGERI